MVHDRLDGKGCQDRLSGEDIPEEAHIVAVADAYDDMTGHWSYRDVRKEIEKGKCTPFDSRFAVNMPEAIEEDTDYTMREK